MAWATASDAASHWPQSSGLAAGVLDELLEVAHRSCATYAPTMKPATVLDGATSLGSDVLTVITATFSPADVGRTVAGAGIAAGARIVEVFDAYTVRMSAAATLSGSAVAVTVDGVPRSYMLAVVYQARDIWTSQQRGDAGSDVVGVGDFVIRARPLSAVVRQLLRPQSVGGFA